MTRSRASAKAAGTALESQMRNHFRAVLPNGDYIERLSLNGAKDRGDLSGVRTVSNQRVVVEVKNVARVNLAGWVQEAQQEAVNDGAPIGLVIHKRHGRGAANDQYVTMTVRELVLLLGGKP